MSKSNNPARPHRTANDCPIPGTDELWDAIIIGQGLAGTTLAWHLHDAGQRVLMLDAQTPVSSSKIAAGLITPITGQRLALSWKVDTFLPVAATFYSKIEARTGCSFFHTRTAVRLFQSNDEQQSWAVRRGQTPFQAHLVAPQPAPILDPGVTTASRGGFAMTAAQLDVAAYLAASRAQLANAPLEIDWTQAVSFEADFVQVKNLRTRRLISCEGYAATRNPYFAWVPFKAAKGDVLTVRFECPMPQLTLHQGIWLAPTCDPQVFRLGATYDWDNLDQEPSASARAELEAKLQAFVAIPYEVLDHQAAVRPIIKDSKALIGMHPQQERLGFFNGLGSKGSLLAPWYADRLAQNIVHATPIPDDCDLRKQRWARRHFEDGV